jgi:hypothetical protein
MGVDFNGTIHTIAKVRISYPLWQLQGAQWTMHDNVTHLDILRLSLEIHDQKRPTRRVITNLAGHLQENEATCQVATKPQTVY